MKTFKVVYEMWYPGAEDDVREAYVLADTLARAGGMVEERMTKEYEKAVIKSVEFLDAVILV